MLPPILETPIPHDKKPQRPLQRLGVLSVAVPLFIFALFGITQAVESRQQGEARVNRSLRVAHEHATKVLDGADELANQLHDLVNRRSDADLRSDEPFLHPVLQAKARNQPQLQSIWIIGANGHPIASSRFEQVDRTLDFRDRDYLQFHAQGNAGRFLSKPMMSRTTNQQVINLSLRYNAPDGSFGGVICISLMTHYFHQFYEDLAADEPGLAIRLFDGAGQLYTSYPDALPSMPAPDPTTLVAYLQGSRLSAMRRIGNYPLYLETAMDLGQVYIEVLKQLGVMLAFGLPAFAALFFAAREAQRRYREALEAAAALEQEISTRRKAEDALLQAQKLEALGRLTGGVAHDFNNALMVISNSAHLLKRHVAEGGQVRLDAIARAVASATKITRQLLAFSRRQALVPELQRLQDKLPPVRDLVGSALGGQIQVSVEVDADTPLVSVDSAELELALLNLAINARDAMPHGGSFRIHARNADGEMPGQTGLPAVAISAADTGSGIAPDALARVFEPFFTTKAVGQGTGLGLSQVYGMCQRAGGTAQIHSELGRGTTVTLYFPAAAAALPEDDTVVPKLSRDLNKDIVIVEDNDEVASSLQQLLEAMGCRATRFDRAAAALEGMEARGSLPDLVLSDIVMPGDMDGLALARHLRAQHPHLPLLLMTGYSRQIDDIVEQGFEVLPKPCSAEQLQTAILRATARAPDAPSRPLA